MTLYYQSQYFTTTLSVGGGINSTQTTGIVAQSTSGVFDLTKPGIACLTWSNPLNTTTAEYFSFTSINPSTKEFNGVTRGIEGFSARSHLNGATIAFIHSKSHINELNKLLDGSASGAVLVTPVVDDGILLNHESSVSTPAAGKLAIYAKNDNKLYRKGSDGTEAEVGSSATVATQAEVATGTDNTKMVTPLAVSRWHMPPQGFMYNGKIVPSVSGGALTVAIKTLAGTDPSASDPVYIRIGDAIRSITSALSVTINGGTNWFGIGTAGLAGNETDLFTFIGLKSSDSSYRLMVGRLGIDGQLNQTGYADGDGTANTYIYPYSQIAATDSIALIGRFAATLSAGPGYTWSVPSYTSSNLIQRPVYETRPLSYTPQIGDGSLGNGSITGTYQIMGTRVRVRGKFTLGSTSTVTGNLNFSKPIQTASESTDIGAALAWDNSATVRYISFTTLVAGNIYPHTGTGSYGYYSTTAPMTWATSDTATYDITYWVV